MEAVGAGGLTPNWRNWLMGYKDPGYALLVLVPNTISSVTRSTHARAGASLLAGHTPGSLACSNTRASACFTLALQANGGSLTIQFDLDGKKAGGQWTAGQRTGLCLRANICAICSQ